MRLVYHQHHDHHLITIIKLPSSSASSSPSLSWSCLQPSSSLQVVYHLDLTWLKIYLWALMSCQIDLFLTLYLAVPKHDGSSCVLYILHCISHILQAVWRWIQGRSHSVNQWVDCWLVLNSFHISHLSFKTNCCLENNILAFTMKNGSNVLVIISSLNNVK